MISIVSYKWETIEFQYFLGKLESLGGTEGTSEECNDCMHNKKCSKILSRNKCDGKKAQKKCRKTCGVCDGKLAGNMWYEMKLIYSFYFILFLKC